MDINHIKEFMIIAEERSYSRASEKLFISQSVLTKHIQKLESELGFSLFVRSYPLTMTPAGVYLYNNVSKVINDFNQVVNKSNDVSKGITGSISVGLPNRTKFLYVPFVNDYKSKHPDTDLRIVINESDVLLQKVQNDLIDIAALYMVESSDSLIMRQFSTSIIYKGKMCVLVSKENEKYKDKKDISIKDLQNDTYLLADNLFHRAVYRNMCNLAAEYDVYFNKPQFVSSNEDALFRVLMNEGFMFVPYEEEDINIVEQFRRLPIQENEFMFTRFFVWKKTNKIPGIKDFIDCFDMYRK